MRILLQPAFVLHLRPFRETSALVEFLTKEHGRITVVVKGVRQAKSRLKPYLQPFSPLMISWYAKTELGTLMALEPQSVPQRLSGECLLSGLYLNELLMRVLHKHDPCPSLYTLYEETLLQLRGSVVSQKYLRLFEKKLLEEIGYGLPLEGHIEPGVHYQFLPEQGFIETHPATQHVMLFSGEHLLAFANESLEDESCLQAIKRLMRLALAPVLGHVQLNSRELFIRKKEAIPHE